MVFTIHAFRLFLVLHEFVQPPVRHLISKAKVTIREEIL